MNKVHHFRTTNKLNLCVTTMMAYVSALTNGGCYKSFAEPLLKQQAEWERMRPLKPLLDGLFQGDYYKINMKKLCLHSFTRKRICLTAKRDFIQLP